MRPIPTKWLYRRIDISIFIHFVHHIGFNNFSEWGGKIVILGLEIKLWGNNGQLIDSHAVRAQT